MKLAVAAIGGALGASACCIGPVVLSLLGAGALAAMSVRLEPYRPWFIGFTVLLVGVAFYGAYRPGQAPCCENGGCRAQSKRTAQVLAWVVAAMAAVLVAFPYYIGWFV